MVPMLRRNAPQPEVERQLARNAKCFLANRLFLGYGYEVMAARILKYSLLVFVLLGGGYTAFLVTDMLSIRAKHAQHHVSYDSECFISETLRVEIGGEQFAFPRNIVVSVNGPDVVNPQDSRSKSASGSNACQKPSDNVWGAKSIYIQIWPALCPKEDPRCNENQVFVNIQEIKVRKAFGIRDVYPSSQDVLLKECSPPKKPYSPWHAKVWSRCDFSFTKNDLFIAIAFRGGIYPPQDIERTKQLVLHELYSYHITSAQESN
jgi:hypothetical protein